MGYLTNFIVYTLAMVGVMVVALLIFKNATSFTGNKCSKNMKVLDSLSLGPRKTLYVVSVNGEDFLIAGDSDRTSLISKLDSKDNKFNIPSIKDTQHQQRIPDIQNFKIKNQRNFNSVMKQLSIR